MATNWGSELMSTEWFYRNGRKVSGPFSSATLRELIAENKIHDHSEVANSYDGPWQPATRLKGVVLNPRETKKTKLFWIVLAGLVGITSVATWIIVSMTISVPFNSVPAANPGTNEPLANTTGVDKPAANTNEPLKIYGSSTSINDTGVDKKVLLLMLRNLNHDFQLDQSKDDICFYKDSTTNVKLSTQGDDEDIELIQVLMNLEDFLSEENGKATFKGATDFELVACSVAATIDPSWAGTFKEWIAKSAPLAMLAKTQLRHKHLLIEFEIEKFGDLDIVVLAIGVPEQKAAESERSLMSAEEFQNSLFGSLNFSRNDSIKSISFLFEKKCGATKQVGNSTIRYWRFDGFTIGLTFGSNDRLLADGKWAVNPLIVFDPPINSLSDARMVFGRAPDHILPAEDGFKSAETWHFERFAITIRENDRHVIRFPKKLWRSAWNVR